MTPLGHVASVVAIWSMMLFGLRFAVSAVHWLLPLIRATYRLIRCTEAVKRFCRKQFVHAIDQLHLDLNRAITTPWSGTLLFSGSILIGFGYAAGCAGDVMKLLTKMPDAWDAFDVVSDCIAAVMSITGMAFIHAATSQRRTASFFVSGALIVSGLGIGLVTL
ncbi:hypothetical protein [Sphingomonas sp.]|uniref:Uncharacterized protein n=1 Tax=Sphingomonas hankookensis TaxID=563996 RepID=A0ABR5YBT3_9SPHN|nr:hypothetical protein [Sphingomonas sp.]KZE14071.1 hypothetical protein AVT10_15070 [Sphingomonas hankookensis]PZT95546.1 MAG: hypothetical protein DI625_02075 [Sphingomonas sp.]